MNLTNFSLFSIIFARSILSSVFNFELLNKKETDDENERFPKVFEPSIEEMLLSSRPFGTLRADFVINIPAVPNMPIASDKHLGPSIYTASEMPVHSNLSAVSERPISDAVSSFKRPRLESSQSLNTVSSFSLNRNSSLRITDEMTIDQVINIEIYNLGISNESKFNQLRKTLQLISKNDKAAFFADRKNFFNIFKCGYLSFNSESKQLFFMRYIIMFGADKLINYKGLNNIEVSDSTHGISEAFYYLVKTKPLDQIISLFSAMEQISFDTSTKMKLFTLLDNAYPNRFTYFQKLSFQFIGSSLFRHFIPFFIMEEDVMAFDMIPDLIRNGEFFLVNNWSILSLAQAALDYPEFFKTLSGLDKFTIFSIVLQMDSNEILEKLIKINPEIISFIDTAQNPHFPRYQTILHRAISLKSGKCIAFLITNFPELLEVSDDLMVPAIEYGLTRGYENFNEILLDCNYNYDSVFRIKDVSYQLLHLTFMIDSWPTFIYFASLAGLEKTKQIIRDMWQNDNQIVQHIITKMSPESVSNYTFYFGLNLNSIYEFQDLEGSAIIFWKNDLNCFRNGCFNSKFAQRYGIDLSVQIKKVNRITNEREIIPYS